MSTFDSLLMQEGILELGKEKKENGRQSNLCGRTGIIHNQKSVWPDEYVGKRLCKCWIGEVTLTVVSKAQTTLISDY